MTLNINFNSLYHDSKHCKLYLGDSLTVLKNMPAASVDMCMTSPPYWGLRAYQTQPRIWDGSPDDCGHEFNERTYTMHNGRGDAQNEIDREHPWSYEEAPQSQLQDAPVL